MERPWRILLIEDDPDDEALAVRTILRSGRHVAIDVVRDGAAGLGLVKTLGSISGISCPDLVLLDIKLPFADGLTVLNELRNTAVGVGVPVVVFSSSDEPRDVRRAMELKADAFVKKPVQYDEYVTVLRRVLDRFLTDAPSA